MAENGGQGSPSADGKTWPSSIGISKSEAINELQ